MIPGMHACNVLLYAPTWVKMSIYPYRFYIGFCVYGQDEHTAHLLLRLMMYSLRVVHLPFYCSV